MALQERLGSRGWGSRREVGLELVQAAAEGGRDLAETERGREGASVLPLPATVGGNGGKRVRAWGVEGGCELGVGEEEDLVWSV